MTAHWIDVQVLVPKKVLLTIITVTFGVGVSRRLVQALFEHLKAMGNGILTRLLDVTGENGSDAAEAARMLIQMNNADVELGQLQEGNYVRCAIHSVQLAVLQVVRITKKCLMQLQNTLIRIQKSKVMRCVIRAEAAAAGLKSTELTHPDPPTRWSTTGKMCVYLIGIGMTLNSIMETYSSDIGSNALITDDWARVRAISKFLRQSW